MPLDEVDLIKFLDDCENKEYIIENIKNLRDIYLLKLPSILDQKKFCIIIDKETKDFLQKTLNEFNKLILNSDYKSIEDEDKVIISKTNIIAKTPIIIAKTPEIIIQETNTKILNSIVVHFHWRINIS